MKILLLSAYDGPSHRYWREGLVKHCSAHQWTQLTLPGRYFNWRIRGNPLSWLHSDIDVLNQHYDLIVATSMVDLATIKGLVPSLAATPSIYYFHENQFEYPKNDLQQRSIDPQMVNLYAALSADRLVFNSAFNRDSFVQGVDGLLNRLPDYRPKQLSAQLLSKSAVVPVPLSPVEPLGWNDEQVLQRWNIDNDKGSASVLKLVWSARWEYDKGPDRLLAILRDLEARGVDFRMAILGEVFRTKPREFELIEADFKHRLVQFGFEPSKENYHKWLQSADIVLSTAIHEFQGLAVLEAVSAGCIPVLPNRLVYPEIVSELYTYASFDDDIESEAIGAVDLIEHHMNRLIESKAIAPCVDEFTWEALEGRYTEILEAVASLRS